MTRVRLTLLAAALLGPSVAEAHALLLESAPPPGATLAAPPAHVRLRFNQRIDRRLGRLQLLGQDGRVRDLPVVPAGPPDRLEAPLPPLGPGRWVLRWHVVADDGHRTSGTVSFGIQP
jgi:methionine-rich copper-binding protein CopC